VLRRVQNPPNPWSSTRVEWVGELPPGKIEVFEEEAKSILSRNESPDIPFRWSVNPYRGCLHGCAYCYARPTHEYLGFGAGTDFEQKVVVKTNAPDLLAREIRRVGEEEIVFSGNTDCYQAFEARYRLTEACLKICARAGVPVTVITKSALVQRDGALLRRLEEGAGAMVWFSIGFLDEDPGRGLEPGVPLPSARFRAMRRLADMGVPVGISLSPILPGLNDHRIPVLLERAVEAGARQAFLTLLRLPGPVEVVFGDRLGELLPQAAEALLNRLRDQRMGVLDQKGFGERMVGSGARWRAVRDLFEMSCKKMGVLPGDRPLAKRRKRRPRPGWLFE
jgi:DNA repair photolyase